VIPVCRLADSRGESPRAENSPVASAARAFEDRRPPKRWHANQRLLDRILRRILVRSIGRCAREAVISISFLFCVFGLAAIPLAHASEPSWAGMWDTEWRGGGARITLQEKDGTVTGAYPAYGGKIEGEVHDREADGPLDRRSTFRWDRLRARF